ncbi:hypothetical protein DPMN_063289 [Dreissena polymorpha]|uniref:Uncharacterized protein n=1 Tax=Dreissena polymorpha TaxID=45954 RepID=A0A9D4CB54_DREPO|nr:hypothetical protein DPMN_063289 [Dreissena polymorpha]
MPTYMGRCSMLARPGQWLDGPFAVSQLREWFQFGRYEEFTRPELLRWTYKTCTSNGTWYTWTNLTLCMSEKNENQYEQVPAIIAVSNRREQIYCPNNTVARYLGNHVPPAGQNLLSKKYSRPLP